MLLKSVFLQPCPTQRRYLPLRLRFSQTVSCCSSPASAGNALLLHCARGGEPCTQVRVRLPAPVSRVTLDDFEGQPPGKLVCAGGCTEVVLPAVAAASPVLLWISP